MSDAGDGSVQFADAAYTRVAKALSRRLARQTIQSLINRSVISVSTTGQISDEDVSIVFDFTFSICGALEDMGGMVSDGDRWFAAVLFARTLPEVGATNLYLGSNERTALHGQLDDDLIREAAAEFASQP